VSELSKKGLKDGISSLITSASSPSLSHSASNYGHEPIPETDSTEYSSLSNNGGNRNGGSRAADEWEDWGSDWGGQGGSGGYQSQDSGSSSANRVKNSSNGGNGRAGPRKSDDWSWGDDAGGWGGKDK